MILPDIRQSRTWDCGITAAQIVLRCLRRRITPEILTRLNASPIDGTDPRALESALRAAGLGVQSGEMTWDDLRHHTSSGRPVVCLVNADGVGHYVVIGAIDCGRARLQDPAAGPVEISRRAFIPTWRDVDRWGAHYRQFGLTAYRFALKNAYNSV